MADKRAIKRGGGKFCSISCHSSHKLKRWRASGWKQKRNMSGSNNPSWKGGISKNKYHYRKIQKERYPEKVLAREKAHYAITQGKLKRMPCEVCGELKVHAHHDDYSMPLNVRWLCRKHHRELHGGKH
jgi:ribosomal protein S27AE